jgi:import inner membrane translocase subunit TIM44
MKVNVLLTQVIEFVFPFVLQQEIEAETAKGSQQIIEQLDTFKSKISKGLEEAQKTELGKKGIEMTEEFAKQAKQAAESIAKQSEQLSQSEAFKTVSKTVQAVKEEIDDTPLAGSKMYKTPLRLRKRKEESEHIVIKERQVKANE